MKFRPPPPVIQHHHQSFHFPQITQEPQQVFQKPQSIVEVNGFGAPKPHSILHTPPNQFTTQSHNPHHHHHRPTTGKHFTHHFQSSQPIIEDQFIHRPVNFFSGNNIVGMNPPPPSHQDNTIFVQSTPTRGNFRPTHQPNVQHITVHHTPPPQQHSPRPIIHHQTAPPQHHQSHPLQRPAQHHHNAAQPQHQPRPTRHQNPQPIHHSSSKPQVHHHNQQPISQPQQIHKPPPTSVISHIQHANPVFQNIESPHQADDVTFQSNSVVSRPNDPSDLSSIGFHNTVNNNALGDLVINKVPPVNAGVLPLAHEEPIKLELFPPFNTG